MPREEKSHFGLPLYTSAGVRHKHIHCFPNGSMNFLPAAYVKLARITKFRSSPMRNSGLYKRIDSSTNMDRFLPNKRDRDQAGFQRTLLIERLMSKVPRHRDRTKRQSPQYQLVPPIRQNRLLRQLILPCKRKPRFACSALNITWMKIIQGFLKDKYHDLPLNQTDSDGSTLLLSN
jgi:hypothetical protein